MNYSNWISVHGLVEFPFRRLQRKNRVFETEDEPEEEPEKKRQLLEEAPNLKPWRLKLKKKLRDERFVIISAISNYGEQKMQ